VADNRFDPCHILTTDIITMVRTLR
jgi:hypothetical protein